MRLLSTDRLELVEGSEQSAPRYAILSHTWGREEVTFQDIQALGRRQWSRPVSQTASAIQAKKGFIKIQKAAALAAQHGYSYIWVDTCCIDKSDSAELSEAINSMFRWYQNASVCYAYMEDVKHGYHDSKGGLFHVLCRQSRWFTRGWTLQELIAPEDVMFYGGDWGYLGSKAHDEDVRISLAEITGIDVRVLEGTIQPSEMSVAARMKWASHRETTRLEDMAYCLLGLFNVTMPFLYGEGTKAFLRLQEEILKHSNDHSIFTWKRLESDSGESLSGLLAETPQLFAYVENYRPMPPSVFQESTTWSMTNQGLRLSLFLVPVLDKNGHEIQDEYEAVLECAIRRGDDAHQSPAVRMRRLYGDQFARVNPQIVESVATPSFDPSHGIGSYRMIFVKQKPVYAVPDFMVSFSNISKPRDFNLSCSIVQVWPEKYWDKETAILRTVLPSHSNRIIGLFRFSAPDIFATVDFAVGLRRKAGGAWVVWYLWRPSMGEPLHQAVASVNGYLAVKGGTSQPSFEMPDWLERPWKDRKEDQQIQVLVDEVKVHGRLYNFIKASVVSELHGISKPTPANFGLVRSSMPIIVRPYQLESPADSSAETWGSPLSEQSQSPILRIRSPYTEDQWAPLPSIEPPVPITKPPVEPPTVDETTTQDQGPARIEDLLSDITTPNSLRFYLNLGQPTPASEWQSKIRTAWAHPPAEDLEKLEIQGISEAETKLLRACKDGRAQEVAELINHTNLECVTWLRDGPNSTTPFNGFRPIHWAAAGGHIETIRTLLDHGANFYARTIQGWSTVHLVALFGRFVAMKWLIEYATDNHAFSYEDESLLSVRDDPLRDTPLHLAVSHVSLAAGDELLALTEILETFHSSRSWTVPNHANETPLHRLAASGPIGSVMGKFMLDAQQLILGRDVDELGRTVLWHAVCAGSAPEVEYLIRNDAATLLMRDKNRMTPLHAACCLGHAEVASALMKAGASPNATSAAPGLTAAHFAAAYNRPDCLEKLIAHGADVHKPTDSAALSFRPIHLAAANGYLSAFHILWGAGSSMEWRCSHYLSRSVSFEGGRGSYQFELVECDMSVMELFQKYWSERSSTSTS
ncbi:hypothetical protein F4861DRAFT_141011 [Xylaria intraflava]|nr:hypothetical protein F4861DRAFT_141011 [Xylaria intraflava]